MAYTKNENLAQEICQLSLAIASGVTSVDIGSTQYHRTFTGGNWLKLAFTLGTAFFSEIEKKAAAGNYFAQKLVCFYPGEDEDCLEDFDALFNVPIIVIIIYTSGQMKLFGDKENPVKLTKKLDIGKKTGRQLSFTRNGDMAYWLE